MPENPPANMPRIVPNVFYDDLGAALEFLSKTFGFETRMSMPGPHGGLMHAEMEVGVSAFMTSPTSSTPEWGSPMSLGGVTKGRPIADHGGSSRTVGDASDSRSTPWQPA